MNALPVYSSDVAFTPAVKAIQAERGSRKAYQRMEQKGSWPDRMTTELERFVAAQRSVFLATASADGQPYIQHRGGPPGFLKVLDDKTIGFADYAGNRQYITIGNLSENPRAQLFLIDYAMRQRVKIWGEARVVEDADLTAKLMPQGYKTRPERAIIFTVTAWDVNCSQHIPQRFEAAALVECAKHVAALEEEVARLRAQLPHSITSWATAESRAPAGQAVSFDSTGAAGQIASIDSAGPADGNMLRSDRVTEVGISALGHKRT